MDKWTEKEFPKAKIVQIEWLGSLTYKGLAIKRPLFHKIRMANAIQFWIVWISITIRAPWILRTAYQHGWDACFRHHVADLMELDEIRRSKRESEKYKTN